LRLYYKQTIYQLTPGQSPQVPGGPGRPVRQDLPFVLLLVIDTYDSSIPFISILAKGQPTNLKDLRHGFVLLLRYCFETALLPTWITQSKLNV